MKKINHRQLRDILRKFYSSGTKDVVMIHGTFGIGKTATVRAVAEELAKTYGCDLFEGAFVEGKFCFRAVLLHQFEAGELKGIPFPSEDKTRTTYLPYLSFPKEVRGILFLDEINLAPPMIQNAAYQIALDRTIGDVTIPDGVLVVAAGNLDDDGAHTFNLARPLQNRMFHFHLTPPTVEEWVDAVGSRVDVRVINFLLWRREFLHLFNEENRDDVTIPTPRMWEKVGRLLIGEEDPEMVELIVSGGVGESVAAEFMAFTRLAARLDLERILEEEKCVPPPEEISEVYALISSLVGYYDTHKDGAIGAKLYRISKCFKRVEFRLALFHQVKVKDPDFMKRIKAANSEVAAEMREEFAEVLLGDTSE